jgi:hypothetical protein
MKAYKDELGNVHVPTISDTDLRLQPLSQEEIELLLAPTQAEAAANAQEAINAEARAYLASTDWMSLRASEGGSPMSQEIKQLRADARARVI